jgi:hypothetical protein
MNKSAKRCAPRCASDFVATGPPVESAVRHATAIDARKAGPDLAAILIEEVDVARSVTARITGAVAMTGRKASADLAIVQSGKGAALTAIVIDSAVDQNLVVAWNVAAVRQAVLPTELSSLCSAGSMSMATTCSVARNSPN